ncbi:hypothetical protein MTO96_000599 [Rhipicephalus appendiculatus]
MLPFQCAAFGFSFASPTEVAENGKKEGNGQFSRRAAAPRVPVLHQSTASSQSSVGGVVDIDSNRLIHACAAAECAFKSTAAESRGTREIAFRWMLHGACPNSGARQNPRAENESRSGGETLSACRAISELSLLYCGRVRARKRSPHAGSTNYIGRAFEGAALEEVVTWPAHVATGVC